MLYALLFVELHFHVRKADHCTVRYHRRIFRADLFAVHICKVPGMQVFDIVLIFSRLLVFLHNDHCVLAADSSVAPDLVIDLARLFSDVDFARSDRDLVSVVFAYQLSLGCEE